MNKEHAKSFTALLLLLIAGTISRASIVTENFTFPAINQAIPDGTGSGVVDLQTVSSTIVDITDVSVTLNITGGTLPAFTGINGDLYAYVQHGSGLAILLNRPGLDSGNPIGYTDSGGFNATFNDAGVNGDVHFYQAPPGPGVPGPGIPVSGDFQPDGRLVDPLVIVGSEPRTATLGVFNSLDASGAWTLFVEDSVADGSPLTLESWDLSITGDTIPEPGTLVLACCGSMLLYAFRRRRLHSS